MGKYHNRKINTYTDTGKSVVPIIQYKYKNSKIQSPSTDSTTRSPCHLWTSPTSHAALSDEVHISRTVTILTNGGCAL